MKAQEKESFPGSRSSKEKPFKMYDDEKDVIVKLTDLEDGWELDKTPSLQVFSRFNMQFQQILWYDRWTLQIIA